MKRKVNGQLRTETRKLRAAFNDMDMVRSPAQSVDALIRGMTDSRAEKMDANFADDVRLEIQFLCSQGLSKLIILHYLLKQPKNVFPFRSLGG